MTKTDDRSKVLESLRGDPGPAGPAGPTGPRGEKGETGAAPNEAELVALIRRVVEKMSDLKGPRGERGAFGPEGKQGRQGDRGDPGAPAAPPSREHIEEIVRNIVASIPELRGPVGPASTVPGPKPSQGELEALMRKVAEDLTHRLERTQTVAHHKCDEHEDCELQSVNDGPWQHSPADLGFTERLALGERYGK